ncbi:MAG: TetR/AcrR family transcriptional regulator [Myxococcota bacterium]
MVRVRLASDQRRAQLLELGVDLFARHAYDELTTDSIATGGGISKGLLFHYFGSKRGFYLATIEHVAQRLLDEVELAPSPTPFDEVQRVLDRFLDFVGEHSAIYRALLRGGLGADPQSQAVIERVRWTIVQRVLGLLDPQRAAPRDEATAVFDRVGLRLYGWVGTTEALSLSWIDHDLSREWIRTLILESFAPVLAAWPRDREAAAISAS